MTRRPLTYRSLWIYYYRYKDTLYFSLSVFAVVVTVSFLLFWKLILPEVSKWFSIQQEVVATRQRIDQINQNISTAASLNSTDLDTELQTVAIAYPSEKDILNIIGVISTVALQSGSTISDYSFTVGKLGPVAKNEPIDLVLAITGSVTQGKEFVHILQEKIPLSEITAFGVTEGSTAIEVKFPYKQYPDIAFDDTKPLTSLSSTDLSLVRKLQASKPNKQLFTNPVIISPTVSPTP